MESEKCELAKEEKEQLGTKETAETLLALVEESADEQGLTATRLKIQTAKRHPPTPPPRQAKPSNMSMKFRETQSLSNSCRQVAKNSSHHQKMAQDQYLEYSRAGTSLRTSTAKKSLYWFECVYIYICLHAL